MIRPWYRSRLFWLGLPGLVFLLWGWLAFPLEASWLRWMGKDHFLVLGDAGVAITVMWATDLGIGFEYADQGFSMMRDTLPVETVRSFPAAFESSSDAYSGAHYSSFTIAYWFVVLIYLAVWLPTLAWWQRRKSRLLKLHAAPPP